MYTFIFVDVDVDVDVVVVVIVVVVHSIVAAEHLFSLWFFPDALFRSKSTAIPITISIPIPIPCLVLPLLWGLLLQWLLYISVIFSSPILIWPKNINTIHF